MHVSSGPRANTPRLAIEAVKVQLKKKGEEKALRVNGNLRSVVCLVATICSPEQCAWHWNGNRALGELSATAWCKV